jgi:hypothetical protein
MLARADDQRGRPNIIRSKMTPVIPAASTSAAPVLFSGIESTAGAFGSKRLFKMACSYAASQGGLIVHDDALTLTTAGLAAA